MGSQGTTHWAEQPQPGSATPTYTPASSEPHVEALQRSYRWRAKGLLGLRSVQLAPTGTVTFIQRFDSALRVDPHAHTLALDGVYVRGDDGELSFHGLLAPTAAEVAVVAGRTAERVRRLLEPREGENDEDERTGWQVCCAAAARGLSLLTALAFGSDADHDGWSSRVLAAPNERIVADCTRAGRLSTPCLRPFAPHHTMVRGGTYYAFQPGNGVHEYAAELAVRYFDEQRGRRRGAPFKCGPAPNAEV